MGKCSFLVRQWFSLALLREDWLNDGDAEPQTPPIDLVEVGA